MKIEKLNMRIVNNISLQVYINIIFLYLAYVNENLVNLHNYNA
jgi:hypothetical protein